jgi:hypothetical protein
MAIPDVEPKEILAALTVFDQELRDQPEWENWEDQNNFKWAIENGERRYPVKKILNIATGLPLNTLSGGPEANSYVRAKGFTIVPLRGNAESDDVQAALVVRAGQLQLQVLRFWESDVKPNPGEVRSKILASIEKNNTS